MVRQRIVKISRFSILVDRSALFQGRQDDAGGMGGGPVFPEHGKVSCGLMGGSVDKKDSDMIRREIRTLLEETFASHHGAYTDKGTSLLETLAGIDHVLASKRFPGLKETIAGHVYHTRFYIVVLEEYITGKRTGKTDWDDSWVIGEVNEAEWAGLRDALKDEYALLMDFIDGVETWGNEDYFGGSIAIIAHCAYHLGAIRQLKEF